MGLRGLARPLTSSIRHPRHPAHAQKAYEAAWQSTYAHAACLFFFSLARAGVALLPPRLCGGLAAAAHARGDLPAAQAAAAGAYWVGSSWQGQARGGGWLGCLPSSPPLYAGNVPGMEACGGAGEQGPQASGLHHLVGAGPLQRDLSCRFLLLHPLCVGGCWARACLSPQWTTSEPLATQWPKGQQAGAAGGARQCA